MSEPFPPEEHRESIRAKIIGLGERSVRKSYYPELQEKLQTLERMKEALQQERNFIAAVLDTTAALVMVVDREGRVVRFNRACQEASGYAFEEICDKPFWEVFLLPEEAAEARQAMEAVWAGQFPNQYESSWVTKAGQRRLVAWANTALVNERREVQYLVASGVDITERREAMDERERLIATLETKAAELERFAYTVSHDLRSPLITVRGHLGLLQEDLAGGQVRQIEQDVAAITEATDRMHQLLQDVMELLRVGRQTRPAEDVPLAEVAREALEPIRYQVIQRQVEVEIPAQLPILRGDRSQLRQLLQNLLENAVKFLGDQPHPRVEIGVRKDGHDVVCYVRDNGIGIDPQYHKRIFRLFEKLESGIEGTGVGLALARRIVESHGGQIWVESEGVGRGSIFCFTVPLPKGPADVGDLLH